MIRLFLFMRVIFL